MAEPFILVGTPNYTNVFPAEVKQNHAECVMEWTRLGIHFKWMTVGRTFVHFARTQICQTSLLLDATHIFWVDDDAVIDPHILPKFLAHDKDVVIAPYFMRRAPFECGILRSTTGDFHDHSSYRNLTTADLHKGLIQVDGGGTHTMLVKTATLRKHGRNDGPEACDPKLVDLLSRLSEADRLIIDHHVGSLPDETLSMEEEDLKGIRSYFVMPKSGTEDMLWCYRAKRKGIEIWCDTDVQSGHVGFPPVVTEAFCAQAENLKRVEKGLEPVRIMRVLPNDISANVPDVLGVSSARHEHVDLSKMGSLI